MSKHKRGRTIAALPKGIERAVRTKRSWLLGTTLVAGLIGVSVVALPSAALASCQTDFSGNPNLWDCNYDENNDRTINVPTNGNQNFSITLHGNEGHEYRLIDGDNGSLFTLDANGMDGDLTMEDGSVIKNWRGTGFELQDASSHDNGPDRVYVNIDGDIEGGAGASYWDGRSGDGFRVTGNTDELTLNIGKTGSIIGADDGIVVLAADDLVINNDGIVEGRRRSNDWGNESEGILVSSNGNFGSRINGDVTITNNGSISGGFRGNGGAETAGYGISVSTWGDVEIVNEANDEEEVASITGSGGIAVNSNGVVSIENHGTIHSNEDPGEGNAGIYVATAGKVNISNDSYHSVMGTDGVSVDHIDGDDYEGPGPAFYLDNREGLTAGLSRDGVRLRDVESGSYSSAIVIDNWNGGVITGHDEGVDINGVSHKYHRSGDVFIDNGARLVEGVPTQGGIIAGMTGDGVAVVDVDGDVVVNNAGTLGQQFDVNQLDEPIAEAFNALGSPFVTPGVDGDNVPDGTSWLISQGILGGRNGVLIHDADYAEVDNGLSNAGEGYFGGLIVALDGNGVDLYDLDGHLDRDTSGDGTEGAPYTDTSSRHAAYVDNEQGLIFATEDGIHVNRVDGNVDIDNTHGLILAGDDGVRINNVDDGNVYIDNNGGLIGALYGDGIQITDVEGSYGNWDNNSNSPKVHLGGHVGIDNGDFSGEGENVGTSGGAIIALLGGSAISARGEGIDIANGGVGVILGEGSWNDAVIDVRANGDSDHETESSGSFIYNAGVIGSVSVLQALNGATLDLNSIIGEDVTLASILGQTDGTNIVEDLGGALVGLLNDDIWGEDGLDQYIMTGSLGGSVDRLSLYSDAASALAVKGRDNETGIINDGYMFGRLNLDGHGENWEANNVQNYGFWGFTGRTELSGSSHDEILNLGVIQTAFADGYESARFDGVNDFYNGGGEVVALDYEGPTAGVLSMMDGGVGDQVRIDHDFHGALNDGYSSFIALDVDFTATDDPVKWWDESTWRADRFRIDGDVDGSTGLIIANIGGSTNKVGDQIQVGNYGTDFEDADLDAFYIAGNSEGYQVIDGVATVNDGLYNWYLQQQESWNGNSDVVLTSGWAPQAKDLPSLVTGMQNTWYDSMGQINDHVYEGHFAANGGGGADLPVGEVPVTDPTAPNNGVWGKVSGSVTNRDASLTADSTSNLTIDTSFDQKTFAMLGGADFSVSDTVRLGVFGGYVGATQEFASYDVSAESKGGTFGAYAAWADHGAYVDGEVKADLLDVTYTSAGGEYSGNSTTIGARVNAGYRTEMGSFFLEPNGTLSLTNTTIDGFDDGNASVDFSNGKSLRAGAGLRIGTTLGKPGEMTTELAVLGKVWNEFEGANQVTLTDGNNDTTIYTDDTSGLFGEVRGEASVLSADRTLSGFASVGAQFSDSFTTVDAKIGLRKGF